MKNYYLLFLLALTANVFGQIVNIPDAAFKAKLLSASPTVHVAQGGGAGVNYITVDINGNGEIEASEALLVYELDINASGITDLTGLEAFTNIERLYCYDNPLGSLDISVLPNINYVAAARCQLTSINFEGLQSLESLYITENLLTTINVNGIPNLWQLGLSGNPITSLVVASPLNYLTCNNMPLASLDVSQCPNLSDLACVNTQLTTLDVSNNHNLYSLDMRNNGLLTSMYLKNGINENPLKITGCFALTYICADDVSLPAIQNKIETYNYVNCHTDSYCSFTPGGVYYTVNGSQRYDADQNGCDASDPVVPQLRFQITDGTTTGSIYANHSGDYEVFLAAGSHTITPALENPVYFNCNPASLNVTYPGDVSPLAQNFCITPNGQHNDLEIYLVPLVPARPGFSNPYLLTYSNKGTHTQSGTLTLDYNGSIMDVNESTPMTTSQTDQVLTWDFSNLQPFESRNIFLRLDLNAPTETPAVNGGDILSFIAAIHSALTDETPSNNNAALRQTVVNAFDPNDKTCLEGNTVGPEMIGDYVHYVIRFENTGTAAAENIVVKDVIDTAKFDVGSLVPLTGSHEYYTRINGNKVEFFFENINLPFDDADNDGYIVFKIKTKPTLVAGDTFSNSASIYFDYNHPIVTDPAVTMITTLAKNDFEFSDHFSIYPNPVGDSLHLKSKDGVEVQSVSIYNTLGQQLMTVTNMQHTKSIDVSALAAGNYFLRITSTRGNAHTQFIKK